MEERKNEFKEKVERRSLASARRAVGKDEMRWITSGRTGACKSRRSDRERMVSRVSVSVCCGKQTSDVTVRQGNVFLTVWLVERSAKRDDRKEEKKEIRKRQDNCRVRG